MQAGHFFIRSGLTPPTDFFFFQPLARLSTPSPEFFGVNKSDPVTLFVFCWHFVATGPVLAMFNGGCALPLILAIFNPLGSSLFFLKPGEEEFVPYLPFV